MEGNKFDLNIQNILQGWEIKDAVREVIANALDEQFLSKTEPIQIFKDAEGRWHIRDFGRGLRIEHFTQNESSEKSRNNRMIGQFGIGLKDAIATFHNKSVEVMIRSRYNDFTSGMFPKSGHDDIPTLHVIPNPPSDSQLQGTEFVLSNCPDVSIEEGKRLFLQFSGDPVIDSTRYGDIVDSRVGVASIYINGVKVNEEENFRFSYNITAPDKKIKKALNRERTNVGRTAYRDRVMSILHECGSPVVAKALVADLKNINDGTEHDEVKWTEVALRACHLLNSAEEVIFLTSDELYSKPFVVDTAKQTGYSIVTVPTSIKDKLSGTNDLNGKPMRDSDQLMTEYHASFKFQFIKEAEMTADEVAVYRRTEDILALIGGRPKAVKEILISTIMSVDDSTFSECLGLWESANNRIVIRRDQLGSLEAYSGTLLHEAAHAISGAVDTTREFEQELTSLLGRTASSSITQYNNVVRGTKRQEMADRIKHVLSIGK